MNQTSAIESTVYVVGDVHGHSIVLEKMLNFIRTDSKKRKTRSVIYFIGDLVDRGPDSKGAVELVVGALSEFKGSRLHLGNHDAWMLDAIENRLDQFEIRNWTSPRNGGMDTINSYVRGNYEQAIEAIRKNYPEHVNLLKSARLYSQHGSFVFVHAGIVRKLPMKFHGREELTWIREEFLNSAINDGRLVIHGHTPIQSGVPEVFENRINIDTGVFYTGRLTCMALYSDRKSMNFYQAREEESEVISVNPNFAGNTESAELASFSFSELPEIDRE